MVRSKAPDDEGLAAVRPRYRRTRVRPSDRTEDLLPAGLQASKASTVSILARQVAVPPCCIGRS
jgi:hypothetical protein